MGVVLLAGSFSLSSIVEAQRKVWFVIPQFPGFVLFLIAGLAETRRIPFDLPEAESELVAGYHSEYSGMKFGMFFVGEYMGVTLISGMIPFCFWRLAGSRSSRTGLVSHQDIFLHFILCSTAGGPSASAIRPAYVLGLEGDVASCLGQHTFDRRGGTYWS